MQPSSEMVTEGSKVYLVTGGAGFIVSLIIPSLLEHSQI